jgi:hypothetical protein
VVTFVAVAFPTTFKPPNIVAEALEINPASVGLIDLTNTPDPVPVYSEAVRW